MRGMRKYQRKKKFDISRLNQACEQNYSQYYFNNPFTQTKEREEPFSDISLQVKGVLGVEQSLETFTVEERLEGANQYFCELCNKKVNARKCLKVRQFPPIMTLALSRFEIDWSTETRKKINDKFVFPLELDITKYKEIPISHPDNLYELKAIIIHRGGAYGGHYHAYIRDEMKEGVWNLKVPEKYSESPKPEEKVMNVGVQKMFTEDPEKTKAKTTEQKEEDLKETTKVTEYNYDECDFPFPYSNPKLRSHWFDFDDSSVTPLPLGRLQRQFGGQSENGYILIYKQRNLKYQFSDPTQIPEPWQNYIIAENIKNEVTRTQYREEEAHIEVLFQPTDLFSFDEESMIKYIVDKQIEEQGIKIKIKSDSPLEELLAKFMSVSNSSSPLELDLIDIYEITRHPNEYVQV